MPRTFCFSGGILLIAGWISALNLATATAQQPLAPMANEAASVEITETILNEGLELEAKQLWADGIHHYETAVRNHPDHATFRQRLTICRLHYDVQRRYRDSSYLTDVKEMSASQALDLYAEVLATLETNYVDRPQWADILRHGTASLEVALTEPLFVQELLGTASPTAIEQFRQNVHLRIAERNTSTRFDLRAAVSFVSSLAREELGLNPTATIMEFTTGAMSALDAYSRFLTRNQLDETYSNIEGNFVGLGVELRALSNKLAILSVIPGGPAEEAGLKPGDSIVRVENATTSENNPDYVADLLRGPEGSKVSLTIEDKQGTTRELSVARRRVEVPCVDNVHLVDTQAGVGYMRLTNFQRTTSRDVEKALWDLHRQGMKSLIVDVRGNPGGLLPAAVEVADRFLASGRIVTTRGRNARENFDYAAHRPNTWSIPMTVLVDSDSASASEIFAGAIHDHRRGTLLGETTYGKGSVQGIFPMQTAKVGLCLTTSKFYSPSGQAISDRGVTPDVIVAPTYIAARPMKTAVSRPMPTMRSCRRRSRHFAAMRD